ncbi:hypothetical protein [Brevibacillus migulae]|uniref:hypothetical protein n=1 Tax=Brevibacillus migulae TaxID=1644114 RepID=UPI00106DE873|nr:hypothetical protein [Brevibacillus migulae]
MRFHQKIAIICMVLTLLILPVTDRVTWAAGEEGIYIGGDSPTYFYMKDILRSDRQLEALKKLLTEVDTEEIFIVRDGQMASIYEILSDRPYYTYDPSRLLPEYTRIADGTRMVINRNMQQEDSEAPEIVYIR